MKLTAHDKPITQRKGNSHRTDPNSITQRAIAAGMNPSTVKSRLKRMSIEEALTKPPMPQSDSASLAGKASRAAARARKAAKRMEMTP